MTDTDTATRNAIKTDAELSGCSIVAGVAVVGTAGSTRGQDPRTESTLEPEYSFLDTGQVDAAIAAAAEAFAEYRQTSPADRATFLDTIADNLDVARAALVARGTVETGLPVARLTGEVARTSGQMRLFAEVVRSGNAHGARIDPAIPERTPLPRLDIRQRKVPLGPVVVFGASNFPLAFSVAGGDTASALAAGCPVIVKAHNAHPGTGEIAGRAIAEAAASCGIAPGVFSIIYGPGSSVGQQLAADPRVSAVGFTGSRSGGLALAATAAGREVPIPVYAEMSSINPVILLDGALEGAGAQSLAEQFVGSLTGSSGQLCTAPGLVFVPTGDSGDAFISTTSSLVGASVGQTMLTPGIAAAFARGVSALDGESDVDRVAAGAEGEGKNAPAPVVFTVSAQTLVENPVVQEEIFGAASVLVRYSSLDELVEVLRGLEGQLTSTIHATESDEKAAERLLPVLEDLSGRILFNGWPTGVEVGHAMVHGGPFPATSAPATTSVGSLAIERFLRPVAYQQVPEALLPASIRDTDPLRNPQMVDGTIIVPGAGGETTTSVREESRP